MASRNPWFRRHRPQQDPFHDGRRFLLLSKRVFYRIRRDGNLWRAQCQVSVGWSLYFPNKANQINARNRGWCVGWQCYHATTTTAATTLQATRGAQRVRPPTTLHIPVICRNLPCSFRCCRCSDGASGELRMCWMVSMGDAAAMRPKLSSSSCDQRPGGAMSIDLRPPGRPEDTAFGNETALRRVRLK